METKMYDIVCDLGDCHNENLRRAINEIWRNNEYHAKLVAIVKAYYERDCQEIANAFDVECVFWKANEVSFEVMLTLVSFDTLCQLMFSRILDDEDYMAIINYIRPKLSFVEHWWDLRKQF